MIGERAGAKDPELEQYLLIYGEGIAWYLSGEFAAAG